MTDHNIDGHGWCEVWDLPKVPPTKQRKGRYVPESFIHPAKMDVGLCRKIIETYTEPGDLVLDPMAGISTTLIEAALLGRNAIGVELEEKFVRISEENIKLLEKTQTLTPKGHAKILKGDARELSKLLAERADSVVFSPPFAGTSGGKGEASRKPINKRYPGLFERCIGGNKGGISGDPANIDNLPYKPDAIITSPPFGEAHPNGNLGVADGNRKDLRPYSWLKSDNPGDIGNLPYRLDVIITSPPYSEVMGKKHHSPRADKIAEEKRLPVTYTDRVGVIVTSPPHSEGIGHDPGDGASEQFKERLELQKRYTRSMVSEGNIGNLRRETYLEAMFRVYSECFRVLKPGGKMVLVVKCFVRNKKVVRLDLDTKRLCEAVGFRWVETKLFRLPGKSFWRILQFKKYGDQIKDKHLLDYEFVMCFEKPLEAWG